MATIIKNWHLVEIYETEVITKDSEILLNVAWGIVVEDSKNRFNNGDFVCTSRIVQLEDVDGKTHMITKSGTLYVGQGIGKVSRLHLEDLTRLRQGFSPDEILLSKNLGGDLVDYTHC